MHLPRQFTEQALAANVAEIKLGELAKGHAQSAAVKQFADMMVRDHQPRESTSFTEGHVGIGNG